MAYPNKALRKFFSQLRLVGGVGARTLAGHVTCDETTEQFCFWDPDGVSRNVTLTAEESSSGLFHFFVNEASTAFNLVIKDDAGSTIVTINQGEWAFVACDGATWRDASSSAFADLLTSINAWTAANTFQNMLFGAATELTIASGAVAATRSFHTLDTETDAASDDLDDITGLAAGEILFVTPAHTDRSIVLRHAIGANKIATLGGRNLTLAEPTDWALLMGNGTQATVIAASTLADGILGAANAWTGAQTFQNVLFGAASELTIASGAIAATRSYHTVDTASDDPSDDLDSITGGAVGEMLLLRPESAARTVVLKHAIGANLIACKGGRDISLAESTDWALLMHNGTQWTVIAGSTLVDGILGATNVWGGTNSFSGAVNLTGTIRAGADMWASCPSPASNSVTTHTFFDDFTESRFSATQWVITEDDAADTQVVGDTQSGVMTLTCKATTDDDATQVTWATESFKLTSGKRLWFEMRIKSSSGDMVNSDWFVGLAEAEDLTGVADNKPANGIGFVKTDAAATFISSSSDNNVDLGGGGGTIVNATWIRLGLLFDGGASGAATITPYIDGVPGVAIPNVTYATMAEMAAFAMVRNGDNIVTQALDVDYVKVVAER